MQSSRQQGRHSGGNADTLTRKRSLVQSQYRTPVLPVFSKLSSLASLINGSLSGELLASLTDSPGQCRVARSSAVPPMPASSVIRP